MNASRSFGGRDALVTLARAADLPLASVSAWVSGCAIRPASRTKLVAVLNRRERQRSGMSRRA